MTSTFLSFSIGGPRGGRSSGGGARPLQPEPLLLARHLELRDLDELAALDLVDGRLRGGAVVGRRVGDLLREPAQVEVLERLDRLAAALAVELARLVGALWRLRPY